MVTELCAVSRQGELYPEDTGESHDIIFLVHPTYLDRKLEGDKSMLEKRVEVKGIEPRGYRKDWHLRLKLDCLNPSLHRSFALSWESP
jgi:hypothetical protein